MLHKLVIILCSLISTYVDSATYVDQRQSGDLNVQVDLKDLHIIALMKATKEEYVDYDYAYDYSEMTIKPQNGTTPKPLNVTSTASVGDNNGNGTFMVNTSNVENSTITLNSTSSIVKPEEQNAATDSKTTTTKSFNLESTVVPSTSDGLNSSKNETMTTISPNSNNITNCRKGFVRNEKGECQMKLQSTGNALIKLVKLSQKLKLRRENRNQKKDSPTA